VEALFWERQRASYLLDGFEGKESLLGDAFNGGVSHAEGAWVLRTLRGWLGEDAFDRGLRRYVVIPAGRPTGLPEFFAAMRAASGRHVVTDQGVVRRRLEVAQRADTLTLDGAAPATCGSILRARCSSADAAARSYDSSCARRRRRRSLWAAASRGGASTP
jgi:hypothetical protein